MRQQLDVGEAQLVVVLQGSIDQSVQCDGDRLELHPRVGLDIVEAQSVAALLNQSTAYVTRSTCRHRSSACLERHGESPPASPRGPPLPRQYL